MSLIIFPGEEHPGCGDRAAVRALVGAQAQLDFPPTGTQMALLPNCLSRSIRSIQGYPGRLKFI